MAGDGGRVPDVAYGHAEALLRAKAYQRGRAEMAKELRSASDPASVLAALLAESPEATVAAIEALLTNGESVKAVARALSAKLHWLNDDDRAHELAVAAVTAHGVAVRSLLSKAPKENGDA
jgi:hypothetical protein